MPRAPTRYRARCVCDWPKPARPTRVDALVDALDFLCSGTGVQYCKGCGGDLCICVCGGERECPGCDACRTAVS